MHMYNYIRDANFTVSTAGDNYPLPLPLSLLPLLPCTAEQQSSPMPAELQTAASNMNYQLWSGQSNEKQKSFNPWMMHSKRHSHSK